MASCTKVSKARRRIRRSKAGRDARKARAKNGTPKFPVNPEKAS